MRCRVDFCVCTSSGVCSGHVDGSGRSPVLRGGGSRSCCKTSADLAFRYLFQCPRVNGVKAHTNKHNPRQVVLDLQIW